MEHPLPEQQFATLLGKITSYLPPEDISLIRHAYTKGMLYYQEKQRFSGDPYITHGLGTALHLADWQMDSPTIAAGILHDAIEDGTATVGELEKEFTPEVARLVWGVTKVSGIEFTGSKRQELAEELRKMIIAMAQDLRVVMIKLADRLHNMETVAFLPDESKKRFSQETIEVYAPLAERFGMGEVKGDLEDDAFPVLYPREYVRVKKLSELSFKKAAKHAAAAEAEIEKSLTKEIVTHFAVNSRVKHLYSLHQKLLRPEIDQDVTKVHDLVAVRVLVETIEDCYLTLGVVHTLYHPVPHLGISDFIAVPKPNGYRSIHTKVFGPEGRIIEIQIRTFAMHREAEYGIASHELYNRAKATGASDSDLESGRVLAAQKKLRWVRELVAWQKNISDNEHFLRELKVEALAERIFVFSPLGDVYDLPVGATPVDFAYLVHTAIGRMTAGAKVNGRLVPLSHQLVNGDICEIVTNPKQKSPNRKWLDFVITKLARSHIRKSLGITKDSEEKSLSGK